ncbi:MAG: MAPEG family protein [Pseudomonadota bacterium]
MTFELYALLAAGGLLFALLLIQGALTPLAHGFKYGLGPRDEAKPRSAFAGRVDRTVVNHMEGLALFVPLIVVAALAGVSSQLTVWGAAAFVGARAAFALFYIAGVPVFRSIAWGVSVVGLIMIFAALLGAGGA